MTSSPQAGHTTQGSALPPTTTEVSGLDPERQQLAREYAGIRRRLFFVELGVSGALVILFMVSGASAALRDWARQVWPGGGEWAAVAAYGTTLGFTYTLFSTPLDYFAGFVLPHRYGLSTQTAGGWALDQAKELALAAVFGLGALELLYWLLRVSPQWWWAIMAVLAWLFAVVMAQLAPVLLMPLFFKFRPLDDPILVERLTSLARSAGARVRGVYVMDMSSRTTAANAMLTGLGGTRRIILGDTLVTSYSADEIETVLAHELAHHVHKDLLKGLAAEGVIFAAGMWVASAMLGWGVPRFGLSGPADIAGLPLFAAAMGVFGLLVMPAGNFLTRQMERSADDYALRVTGKPGAFRSVMLKLASQNLADADPPAWVRFLFSSHPTPSERVRAITDWESKSGKDT